MAEYLLKILTLDIETSPNLAHVWGLWDQNVGITQLREASEVMCIAAKWHGSDSVIFYSQQQDGQPAMIRAAHELLSEADIVVHYNGARFDIPHLNREFIEAGLTPPAPYAQVDLLRVVKKQFRFPSNKLDYVCQALDLGAKQGHTGHQLWIDCLAGDEDAWALMRQYNEQDVRITEKLYDRLLPWISTHPTVALYENPDETSVVRCPNCGGEALKPRGKAYTSVSVFQRYRCDSCGRWSRGSQRLSAVSVRGTS